MGVAGGMTMRRSLILFLLIPALAGAEPVPAAPAPEDRPFRIVCFGDSITGHLPGQAYLHQYLKWTDLLALVLETHLGEGRVEVLNRGYGGDGTSPRGDKPGAMRRLQAEVLDLKPDVALVLIGGNNFAAKDRDPREIAEELRGDLTDMVRRMKEAGVRVLLLQYHAPKAADMTKVWSHLDRANPVIAEVAATAEVPTLELAPAFREAERHQPLHALTHPVDGVHLAPYGEIVVARSVFTKLRDLGWVKELRQASGD